MAKSLTIGRFEIPINNSKKYVPVKAQSLIGQEEDLERIAFAIRENMPVLMIGETGVGKTSLIRHLAFETQSGFRRLNLNGQTTVDEFVGKILLDKNGTFWQDGVLIDAMRNGYWLLLDEINAALPEILFVLHSLLDDDRFVVLSENGGEVVRPHENFRLFATMNPSGKYAGTKELNKAFVSRFPMVIQMEFPSEADEVKIIQQYTNLDKKVLTNLVKMATDLRKAYEKDDIDFMCSTRDLISCGRIAQDIGVKDAIRLAIVNRCTGDDIKAVNTVVSLYFGALGAPKTVRDFEKEYKLLSDRFAKYTVQMGGIGADLKNCSREITNMTSYHNTEAVAMTNPGATSVGPATIHASDILRSSANMMGSMAARLGSIGSSLEQEARDLAAKVKK